MKPQNVMMLFGLSLVVLFALVCGDDTSNGTTQSPENDCQQYNDNCETCVKHASCLWCESDDEKCIVYPKGQVIPKKDVCPLDDARWGVCWLNYKILLITMACIAVVLIIVISVCCYCCCCRTNKRKQQKKFEEEDASYERQREERRMKSEERRSERRSKYDDIRRKYGLIKEDQPRYQRFENETA